MDSFRNLPHLPGAALLLSATLFPWTLPAAAEMPNACPIDGCQVKITDARRAGDEVELTFDANFQPDVARNHFHVWWGELYKVRQVGRNAKAQFGVTQGRWHRHDDYPRYVTRNAASTAQRKGATTLCVTAADGGHNVLDPSLYHCVDVSALLPPS
ncbi:MAG TPA: hypothetical protein ENJ94_05735 [Gammaproteobacteria bacterium]|nr:hypothetical protein [Gammaproteobacteria bacterium]